jgi:hypothetical protein
MKISPYEPHRGRPKGLLKKGFIKEGGDMRKVTIMIMAVAVLLFAMNAYAGIQYSPNPVSVQAEQGKSASQVVRVMKGSSGAAGATLALQGLPAWARLSETQGTFDPRSGAFSTAVIADVPADAQPGRFSGLIVSDQGDRVGVSIIVTQAQACDAPSFEGTSIGPDSLWAPNNKAVNVTITGAVESDCGIAKAEYQVTNDGEVVGTGGFEVVNGAFAVEIPIVASRSGEEKDGRTYVITLTAENEDGEVGTSDTFYVNVAHDQGAQEGAEALKKAKKGKK